MSLSDTIQGAIQRETPVIGMEETMETVLKTMTGKDSFALLVKAGDELVGIVNDTDVLHCLAGGLDIRETKVADIMTECQLITREGVRKPCVQIDENEQVHLALKIMNEAGVHHLLVSSENGRVVGLVSAADLLKQAVA